MIIKAEGTVCQYQGRSYAVGDTIQVVGESDYKGLYGRVTEIYDGEDKVTELTGLELCCDLERPVREQDVSMLLERLFKWDGWPRKPEDLALHGLVATADMVEPAEQRTYRIPLVWQVWGVLSVDAFSLRQALDIAHSADEPLPDEEGYVDESLETDADSLASFLEGDISEQDEQELKRIESAASARCTVSQPACYAPEPGADHPLCVGVGKPVCHQCGLWASLESEGGVEDV